jgi:endonuclease/exonuclease/phosphatase family metal-dependent hydrolase
MPSLRVATWNIAGARREAEADRGLDLAAVVAGVRALGADLLALQEVDRELARSDRVDQPRVLAEALGPDWFWSFAPALVGDDLRPLGGPDPGGPAYGNQLLSRLPLEAVEQLRFPPAGGCEQRTALVATVHVGTRPLTVAGAHLSNRQGRNLRQLRQLQAAVAARPAPRLLLGDLNLPGPMAGFVSGWRVLARVPTYPAPSPRVQLDHVLLDPRGGSRMPAVRAVETPAVAVSDHRPLVVEFAHPL